MEESRAAALIDAHLMLSDLLGWVEQKRSRWVVRGADDEVDLLVEHVDLHLSRVGLSGRLDPVRTQLQRLPRGVTLGVLPRVRDALERSAALLVALDDELRAEVSSEEGWRPLELSSERRQRSGTRRQSYKANNAAG